MKYQTSLPKLELSYRLKCVAVESERVYSDELITRNIDDADFSSHPIIYQPNRHRNLLQQYLDTPDFLELNRPRKNQRRHSTNDVFAKRKAMVTRSKSLNSDAMTKFTNVTVAEVDTKSKRKDYTPPTSIQAASAKQEAVVHHLVDRLLFDIYGSSYGDRSGSESTVSSWHSRRQQRPQLQLSRLERRSTSELRVLLRSLRENVMGSGSLLVKKLRQRDFLLAKREQYYDVITAYLQAHSDKRSEDTRMRFSLTPQPGESGFNQWLDAMKMVAKLQGGIPAEFRRKLWVTLSERHLEQRKVDWEKTERECFSEWTNPDDEELGIQIVKDLHRTGCSLFCGAAGRDNQAVLRRVLLGYARWNKSVGYCQGLNVLAALILQVVDRDESAAVKVMIYLIEGVLPEGYFADSLRGLSIDMAVFRDLLRMRLPRLSKHLESLQNDLKDKATGNSYEPPLTNVFTMQWFLTLFCHCLPQDAVLRVWDLIFLEGDDVLLRTALAIWEGISDRIMTVTSADEFYSIMGVLTREMLEFTDTNHLIKTIVSMGQLHGITGLREKHRYNITPWARRLSDDEDSDTEDDERLAVAAAAAIFAMPRSKKSDRSSSSSLTVNLATDRERIALDISTLKQQYAKLRERQRQAHVILSAACARQTMGPTASSASQAMNHLLVGKSALVSGKNRPTIRPAPGLLATRAKSATSPRTQNRKQQQPQQQPQQQGVTIHWKDMKKRKDVSSEVAESAETASEEASGGGGATAAASSISEAESSMSLSTTTVAGRRASGGGGSSAAGLDSDSDSTSTELCDEPDRMSDLDSEELTSTSDACPIVNESDEKCIRESLSPVTTTTTARSEEPQAQQEQQTTSRNSEYLEISKEETSIAEITDQIRRLSADDADFTTSLDNSHEDSFINKTKVSSYESSNEASYSVIKEASSILDDSSTFSSRFIEDNNLTQISSSLDDTNSAVVHSSGIFKTFDTRTKNESSDVNTSSTSDLDYNFSRHELVSDQYNLTNFNDDAIGEVKTSEISDSVIPNVSKLEEEDEAKSRSEVKYLTRSSYVIGHLPIAPMSFESRKPGRISPEVFVPRDEVRNAKLERNTFEDNLDATILNSETKYSGYKFDVKRSPKTPESFKSFDSGETMGPDSITSSVAVTPLRSDSRGVMIADKSVGSSVSSDSKTLTMRSAELDTASKNQVETPGDKSVTPLTDSLMQTKSVEPPCSSTESFCSPTKAKSERSFSSDLQSPISANSIKFTSGYNYKNDGIDLQEPPTEIGAITSPFYPISHPNKKTPSPYGDDKNKTSKDTTSSIEFRGINEDLNTKQYLETKSLTRAFEVPQLTTTDDTVFSMSIEDETFKSLPTKLYAYDYDDNLKSKDDKFPEKEVGRTSAFEPYRKSKFEDELQETDTLSPLPRNQFNEIRGDIFERTRGRSLDGKLETLEITGKSYERSSSSLEKRFPEMLLSPSMEDFANSVKKRSSDVLEDLRHLESKSTEDGEINPNMLTRKTSYIWEDLKSLEARRQDTFSDSAKEFSRQRVDVPGISISMEGRKTYIVEPKINIDENSDSILKAVTYKNSNGRSYDIDDDRESKLGVWTKVKPRKRSDNGRRSSDRALKIIQENSAILQKILTCQARKRLPDLEEISKEITISPINEEISKIFSPIFEKMGLNEHEINEELARINFKDIDRNTTTTTASEFEAKINDELSKLSLIGDNEEVAYLPDVDDLSTDYLVAREAFIDRQINEELSKLLVNYSEDSPMTLKKNSTSLNTSDDLSMSSKKSYSYKSSSNDSIDIKSDLGTSDPLRSMIYPENSLSYVTRNNYSKPREIPTKSDVDIYRELEKLDHISYSQALPSVTTELPPPSMPYVTDIMRSPKLDYPKSVIDKQPTYDISPLKSPYDSPYSSTTLQSSYDYKSRISPRKVPSNPYSVRSYDAKSNLDTGFENTTFELTARKSIAPSTLNYEYGPKKHILSKEHLEFRVKYDLDDDLSGTKKSSAQDIDLKLSPFQTDIAELDKGASYYSDKQVITPTNKYSSSKDNGTSLASTLGTSSYESTYRRKYDGVSPADKYSTFTDNYDPLRQPYKITTLDPEAEVSAYLSGTLVNSNNSRHRDTHVLSPNYQYDYSKSLSSSYATASPSFDNSLTTSTRTKMTYSDISPTDTLNYRKTTLAFGNLEENKDVKYGFDKSPSPKSLGFSPFPVRNLPRKPKEVAVKLGLYSPTNSTPNLKRS